MHMYCTVQWIQYSTRANNTQYAVNRVFLPLTVTLFFFFEDRPD